MKQTATVLLGLEAGLLRGLDSLKWTVEALQKKTDVVALSTIIQGFHSGGSNSLKVVVKATVSMNPPDLLRYLCEVEADYAENKDFMESLRCYLLAFEHEVSMTPHLLLPHPQMVSDPGWLYCSWEVWRNYRHPVLEFSLEKLLAEVETTNVQFFSQAKAIFGSPPL
jgi:7,8-dihydro-6-hydroxymethylpterin-pyrophosphokinase